MWRVLVVDDNFVNRKLLVELLKDVAECAVATDGRQALDAYRGALFDEKPYDLVLLDIAMPDVGGIEVLRTIREDEKSRSVADADRIPVLIVTIFDEFFSKAFEAGCTDYILKPIDVGALKDKILAHLSARRGKKS